MADFQVKVVAETILVTPFGYDLLAPLVAAAAGSAADAEEAAAASAGSAASAAAQLGLVNTAGATQITAVNNAGAAAAATLAAAGVVGNYANAVKAALGSGTQKLLLDMDGSKTFTTGSIVSAMTSLDDTPVSFGLHSTIFSGADPRPVYTAGRGIYFNAQAGLTATSGFLTKTTGNWAIMEVVDTNVPLFATVGLKTSLAGGVDGDISLVNGDANTIYSPDVVTVLDQAFANNELINGIYKNLAGSWIDDQLYLWSWTAPNGSYFKVYINKLGQLYVSVYNGGAFGATVHSVGTSVYGTKFMYALRRYGNFMYLWLNGRMIDSVDCTGLVITTFNTFYLNGQARTAAGINPIGQGLRHYKCGFEVIDDATSTEFTNSYNEMAKRHAMWRIGAGKNLSIVLAFGQSWMQGATDCSFDTYTSLTASGQQWDGMVDSNNASRSGEKTSVTREAPGNLFACSQLTPSDIGPYSIGQNTNGNQIGGHSANSTGENCMLGWIKQVNSRQEGRDRDWLVVGTGSGGAMIEVLSFESIANPSIAAIKTLPLAVNDYLLLTIRQMRYAVDWARANGYTSVSYDLGLWQQGGSNSSSTSAAYQTLLYALYDRFVTLARQVEGLTVNNPLWLLPQVNYSPDGVTLSTNLRTAIDQTFLDIEDNRGSRPIFCVGPTYPETTHIHPPKTGHRWCGESFGLATIRAMFDGWQRVCMRPTSYVYTANGTTSTIDIMYSMPNGGTTPVFQAANNNNIPGTQTINGVNTQGYGFFASISSVTVTIASPGVVTWTAHGLSNGSKVRLITTGALPTGLAVNTDYFVVNAATNTFQLAATSGGAAINTTGTQSGTHTAHDTTVGIASVAAITGGVRVTLTSPITAAMVGKAVIQYTGLFSRVGNVTDGQAYAGLYHQQDYTVTFSGNSPVFTLAAGYNDLMLRAAASSKVL